VRQGANVLVDDKIRCVISDFGQSEMKSEVYRITGTSPPREFAAFYVDQFSCFSRRWDLSLAGARDSGGPNRPYNGSRRVLVCDLLH
jgi:hypothetical protein